MLPCAGLPKATGVMPLVAANSWPGGMVRTFPALVVSSLNGDDREVEGPDEQAATVINAVPAATDRWTLHGIREGLTKVVSRVNAMKQIFALLVPLIAHLVGRRPRLSRLVSGQRNSHASDLDLVGLLAGADLSIGVLLGQVVELVDGGFVVGNE